MLEYLLKSSACMAALLVFYQFLLEKENMHKFKRFFLLGALVTSLIIPGLVFTEYVEASPQSIVPTATSYNTYEVPLSAEPATDMEVINWSLILWTIYGLGFLAFGFRFTKHLYQILYRIRKNPKLRGNFITRVLLQEKMPPHTFFSYIFLNKEELEKKAIPSEVLLHEETHAKQFHSLDVLFIELLQVVLWFNPLLFLFKKNIKLNHEFLADNAVLNQSVPTKKYQNTLLSYLSTDSAYNYQSIKMANAINYSSTRLTVFGKTFEFGSTVGQVKKRFKVMKKQTSKSAIFIRTTLLVPVTILLIYGFSQREILYPEKEVSTCSDNEHIQIELVNNKLYTEGKVFENSISWLEYLNATYVSKDGKKANLHFNLVNTENTDNGIAKVIASFSGGVWQVHQVTNGKLHEISEENLANYDNLAKKYNAQPIEKRVIPLKDLRTLESLYSRMTLAQKKNAQPFPECLPKNVQKGASREQMAEYNVLAKKYNEMPKSDMRILMKDVEKLKYIYSLMSDKQKADAEPFPDFPEPPAPPKSPKVMKGEASDIPPPPTKAPKVRKGEVSDIPPPPVPPEPQSPLDHVIDMAKKGATFYYEGEKVSSDKAIELLKKNKSLNIETTRTNSKNPQVKISKKPITIGATKPNIGVETGNINVNGNTLFYSKRNGVTSYFNEDGEAVDAHGEKLAKAAKMKPTFYFNGERISSVKAHKLLRNNRSIQVATEDINETEYAIVLTDLNKPSYKNPNVDNNPNSVIDLTEMISKEAAFFYNDEPITTEKAIWLTQNEEIERVQTVGSKNGKPKVYFWKKV